MAIAKVLIIDGDPTQMKVLRDFLVPEGYEAESFSSVETAFAALRAGCFDLVLADLALHGMDGVEFLRRAREIDSDLVGVIMTNSDSTEAAAQASRAESLDYIVRPFVKNSVLAVIARAHSLRQLRLENIHLQQAVGIYELSMVIRLTLDFDAVLNKIADAAMGHSQIQGVSVLLPAKEGKVLSVAKVRGQNTGDAGRRIPFSIGLSRWIDRSLKRLSRLNELADSRAPLPLKIAKMREGTALPMLAGGSFIGILYLSSVTPGRPSSPGQVKALNVLAGAAAAALASASLLEQLRSAEGRYRSLSESAGDIIFRFEGLPKPAISYMNPVAGSILGYSPYEFYADPALILKVVHPGDRHIMETVLAGGYASGTMVTFQCIHKDGSTVWIELSCTLVKDVDGGVIAVDSIARNITERQQLEEQLRQSQKLEAIGLLAGGVAHDFNNLLSVIIGYADLIVEDDKPTADVIEKVSQVKKAAEQASALTRQLLAFGSKQVARPIVLNLNSAVENSIKLLRRLIGEDIELALDLSADLGRIRADTGQIEQILMNLTVNSRGAMPHGGKITVRTQNFLRTEKPTTSRLETQNGPCVMLSVSDSGCGMDAATQLRMFEPFFTTKEPGKGTGLGLSVVYGIVKQSGGGIRVFSEEGKGTTFEILFPRTEDALDILHVGVVAPSLPAESTTILAVEDHKDLRSLVSAVLLSAGYKVLSARDGKDALQICEEHKGEIGLLVTDLVMPGMNGPALVKSIQPLNPGIKVLYMSGYGSESITSLGAIDPSVPFIQKPFTPSNLISRVREILKTCDSPGQLTFQVGVASQL